MIGVLIAAGLIFYAVLYSGVRSLRGDPIGTLDALMGREPKFKAPSTAAPSTKAPPR